MSGRPVDPRLRRSKGITRRRIQHEARRAVRPMGVIAVGIVLTAALAAWFVLHISDTFGRKTYEVSFAVDSAFGVFEGFDEVRFRGVPAGTIEKIERRGDQVVLLAKLQSKYGPVFRDARAQLRPITPLNDIYLDIVDPGTPRAGKAVAEQPLPEGRTTTSTSVPEVLDGLTADARRNAHRLLDNLGNGLQDGGATLRQAFVQLGPFLQAAGTLTREAALHRAQTQRLVRSTGLLAGELATREGQLRRLVSTGAATLGTVQRSEPDLDATLGELAPTLEELQASLRSVRRVAGTVDTGLTSLTPVADRLPQALRDLRQLSDVLQPAAVRLQPAVVKLAPWARQVERLLRSAGSITTGLLVQTPVIDRAADDLVKCKDAVIRFFQWNASLTKMGDTTGGPIPRGNLAFGVPAISGNNLREPVSGCAPGHTIRGPVTPKDQS